MATFYFNDGHTYQIVKTAKTWSKAQADAKAAGGSLAIVNSEAENNFILGLAEKEAIKTTAPPAPDGGGARYLWLGATDSAKEGEWKWTDKTSVTYNNWAKPTEPDNYPSNLGTRTGLPSAFRHGRRILMSSRSAAKGNGTTSISRTSCSR
jgi:hypothetical protein